MNEKYNENGNYNRLKDYSFEGNNDTTLPIYKFKQDVKKTDRIPFLIKFNEF